MYLCNHVVRFFGTYEYHKFIGGGGLAALDLSGPGPLAYRLVAVRGLNDGGERLRFRHFRVLVRTAYKTPPIKKIFCGEYLPAGLRKTGGAKRRVGLTRRDCREMVVP